MASGGVTRSCMSELSCHAAAAVSSGNEGGEERRAWPHKRPMRFWMPWMLE
jgi:hypothetical protein